MNHTEVLDRLADRMRIGDGCWPWVGSTNPDGYGNVTVGGKIVRAHRVVYELLVGPIPEGLVMDHLCRTRGCVRPSHLEPVTNAENLRRGKSPSAINRAKTHCPAGHAYDDVNTYVYRGRRQCRACHRTRERIRSARRRDAA